MLRKCLWAGTAAAALTLLPAQAEAAVSCTASTVAVAFGAYDPRNATATDGVGTLTISCAGNAGSIVASSATGQSGTYTARVMKAGSFSLSYNLYTTTTRNVVWGNGSGGSVTRTLAGPGSYTIYGRIPPLQNVGAGSYTNTVNITITF